jgi:ketosteroid isomerase-like protein
MTMSNEKVELARRAFDAYGRGDPEALLSLCDPQIEMQLTGVAGEPVLYAGADGIREMFRDMAESWSSFAVEIEEVHDLDDRVLVIGEHRNRGRASDIDIAARRGWLIEFRGGSLIRLRSFRDPEEALRQAQIAPYQVRQDNGGA